MSRFEDHEVGPVLGDAGTPQVQIFEIQPMGDGGNFGSQINVLAFQECIDAGFSPEQARDWAIFAERTAVRSLVNVFCTGADNYRLGFIPGGRHDSFESSERDLVGATYFKVTRRTMEEIAKEQEDDTAS